jgi:DNA-binding transcriptional LysR family regulator
MVSYKNMRAFVEVAQAATFADAAKRLFLSQPALSASIKNMEIQLGGKLFIRTTRRIELTPEGRAFLPQAKRVLADYDASLEDVKALFLQCHRLPKDNWRIFSRGSQLNMLILTFEYWTLLWSK